MLSGCGGERPGETTPPAPETERASPSPGRAELRVEPASCPPAVADCVTASGRIAFVERVDPDGDGDAHFVLLSADGVTAPGISVIDVAPELRPHPLPGPGDEISAAGPVREGSFGQRQVEATVVHVARAGAGAG